MQSHGTYQMYITDQTIVITIYAAWNLEAAQSWGRDYISLVTQIESHPWACLIDLSNAELPTPDALSYFDEINQWGRLHNQKYEAIIGASPLQKFITKVAQKNLTDVEIVFFDNLKQGKEWLRQFGIIKDDL